MTAIRKMSLQIIHFQRITDLTTDYCTSNDRFGFIIWGYNENGYSNRQNISDNCPTKESDNIDINHMPILDNPNYKVMRLSLWHQP